MRIVFRTRGILEWTQWPQLFPVAPLTACTSAVIPEARHPATNLRAATDLTFTSPLHTEVQDAVPNRGTTGRILP